jgi:enoyl-CoA hydratase/carnithine racemase
MPGEIRLETHGAVVCVTLSNPGKLGAMSRAMWRELKSAFERIQAAAACRCVIVRGEGGAFCAGGDISEYPSFRFDVRTLRDFHEGDVWGALREMLYCDVPIVAQIEGPCMGAGLEIASCCDIRVAEDSARFGAPIAKLGFPMAPREAQVVARAAGESTLRQMLLEAAVLDAAELKARGFLHWVVPQGDAAAHAEASAQRIATLAPNAARMNKRTLRAMSSGKAIPWAFDYATSEEHHEGIEAFLHKRNPEF